MALAWGASWRAGAPQSGERPLRSGRQQAAVYHPIDVDGGSVGWEAVDPFLSGSRIVQLGESAHGVREFSAAKVGLIRHLHERLGFDVLLFETSLLDCWYYEVTPDTRPADYMRKCAFGVWWTEDVRDLFAYILETRRTDHPLEVMGFDVQFTSRAHRERATRMREFLAPWDSAVADEIARLDSTFVQDYQPHDPERYAAVADRILSDAADVAAATGRSEDEVVVLGMALRSVAAFQGTLSAATAEERVRSRDQGMARNVVAIARQIHPGRKIITWAHNFHVGERNSRVEPYDYPTMGEWVTAELGDQVYTIGFYMGSGTAANNDRSLYTIEQAAGDHLEALFSKVDSPAWFADLSEVSASGQEWPRREGRIREWGRADLIMVPAEQYDGMVFIRDVHPPSYVEAG